ncbi:tRNA epoxyqueuosine(34) reductase QueG [Spirochaeta africana]|uniref:Uncharacterized Fe-S protein n=1 Tax=Spirochaeta africana (strain ATCC 700263 / DSM 8902 / Z-7692) TaxID=889378 RepID=H9UIS3_SPIAZ|nr:tRNA epoxyqueuosine(34) reductase QueG [Spirochaeta africana]AFG37416.1 uncharacterized Fe-S protein [Spirochaeta africana DSM 8902]
MISQQPYFPPVPDHLAELFHAEGLGLMGIAPAVPPAGSEHDDDYRTWLERGFHGSMAYLQRHAHGKYHPEAMLPGCRSILIAGLNYYQHAPERPAGAGRIARYAWGRDYHKTLGKRLLRIRRRLEERFPDHGFRNFTDATPLAERYFAEQAGIGFQGRNTLLISGQYGSWFVLGEILTTMELSVSSPSAAAGQFGNRHGACPRSCTKCIDVCPTGALYAPHRIDASRCISYLTIEHSGSIPVELRRGMRDWLFGCDLCQEVCPLNVRRQVTGESDFLQARAGDHLDLTELLAMESDKDFLQRFAGSPVMRAGRIGMMRNACVVAANTGAHELLPRLRQLADGTARYSADPAERAMIAEHAAWAVSELMSETSRH